MALRKQLPLHSARLGRASKACSANSRLHSSTNNLDHTCVLIKKNSAVWLRARLLCRAVAPLMPLRSRRQVRWVQLLTCWRITSCCCCLSSAPVGASVQRASMLFWRRLRAGATYGGAVIGMLLLVTGAPLLWTCWGVSGGADAAATIKLLGCELLASWDFAWQTHLLY